jgi:chromate transporter
MLLTLFLTFAKIGLFTFGGGYAMLSMIEHICVTQKHWITHDDLVHVTVIAESTPGPVAINCATFVGYRQKGFPGALAATLGVILPSFVIIFLISLFLDRFLEIAWVANAFKGIRVAVGILIVDVAVRMFRKMPKDLPQIVILAVSFAAMLLINIFSWKISTILLLLAAALAGLAVSLVRGPVSGEGGERP